MGPSIVEYALDSMTDAAAFEQLATEVMRDEGYPAIVPLGGAADGGKDAVEEQTYINRDIAVTVFQFTLRRDVKPKVEATLKRLRELAFEFSELQLVTARDVSTEAVESVEAWAHREHQARVRVRGRRFLASRLANYENGIFHRYLASIRDQLADLEASGPAIAGQTADEKRLAMYKSCLMFGIGAQASHARSRVFDRLTLAALLMPETVSQGTTIDALVRSYGDLVPGYEPPRDQVRASLDRLVAAGLVRTSGDMAFASDGAARAAEDALRHDAAAEADIVADAMQMVFSDLPPQPAERERLADRNIRECLGLVFELWTAELAGRVAGSNVPAPPRRRIQELVAGRAGRDLGDEMGDRIVTALADIVHHPTDAQAQVLADWTRASIAVQILCLDPDMREFREQRLSDKTFVLDTDYVLDCVVPHRPEHDGSLALVRALAKAGCKVVVPDTAVSECARHAAYSVNTFKWFSAAGLGLSPQLIEAQVHNAFVQGYLYGLVDGAIAGDVSYSAFLTSYLEHTAPEEFFCDVVLQSLPDSVTVLPLSDLAPAVEREELARMTDIVEAQLLGSRKSEYRTDAETRELASNDAELYLATRNLALRGARSAGSLFGRGAYLISSSRRYCRAALEAGLPTDVAAHPAVLLSVLDIVLGVPVDAGQLRRLYGNPFLSQAVADSWDDITALVRSGVSVIGVGMTRLKCDLAARLHRVIAETGEAGAPDGTREGRVASAARAMGYQLTAPTQKIAAHMDWQAAELDRVRAQNAQLQKQVEETERALATLTRKRRKWLDSARRRSL
jgi:hypothetical protein